MMIVFCVRSLVQSLVKSQTSAKTTTSYDDSILRIAKARSKLSEKPDPSAKTTTSYDDSILRIAKRSKLSESQTQVQRRLQAMMIVFCVLQRRSKRSEKPDPSAKTTTSYDDSILRIAKARSKLSEKPDPSAKTTTSYDDGILRSAGTFKAWCNATPKYKL